MENIVALILQKYNKPYSFVLKNKRGKSPMIYLGDFIYGIIKFNSGKDTQNFLGISEQTFNRLVKKAFPDIKLQGGGQTWSFYLLTCAGYKRCYKCDSIKELNSFHNNIHECKSCYAITNKYYYNNNKKVWDTYYLTHQKEYVERNARRRAITKQATPKWANLAKIKQIYFECPPGYHVDHIVPLNGTNVCGLHVENNLQYLLAEDNLKKSNKFE